MFQILCIFRYFQSHFHNFLPFFNIFLEFDILIHSNDSDEQDLRVDASVVCAEAHSHDWVTWTSPTVSSHLEGEGFDFIMHPIFMFSHEFNIIGHAFYTVLLLSLRFEGWVTSLPTYNVNVNHELLWIWQHH